MINHVYSGNVEQNLMEIKVLTFNVWGIPYLARDLETRIQAICDELGKGEYDIINLQEVWQQHHYEKIKNAVVSVLPYSNYFHSGAIGTGCATFSRYPITDIFFTPYRDNGNFWNIFYGDWYAGKGVGCVVIKHPLKTLQVFNTHLHAPYDSRNHFSECRSLQLFQAAKVVRTALRPGCAAIFTGDLNTFPHEIGMEAFLQLTGLQDAHDTIARDIPLNTMCSSNKYMTGDPLKDNRVDYIFSNDAFDVVDFLLAMREIPSKKIPYSDHEGVTATLRFKTDLVDAPHQQMKLNTLRHLCNVITKGEELAGQWVWFKVLLILLLGFVALIAPLLNIIMLPSIDSILGKVVFLLQMSTAVFCVNYMWLLVVVCRIQRSAYTSVKAEVKCILNSLGNECNHKKIT